MQTAIQPLTGHPYHIDVEVSERSPQELKIHKKNSINREVTKLHLADPPVVLTQEGGGEFVINRGSMLAQLDYRSQPDCDPITPDSLVVYVIDHKKIDERIVPMLRFFFGPIQNLTYQKKDKYNKLKWRVAMRTIFEDKVLYELISMELFRGKKLEIRHFISILKRANIAEGSISKLRKDIINDTKEKQIENKTVNTEKKKSNSETEDDKKSEIPTEHIERKTENIAQEKTEENLAQNKSELPKKLGILAKRVRENKIDKRLG